MIVWKRDKNAYVFLILTLTVGFSKEMALLVAIAAIFSNLLTPILNIDLASGTSEEGGDTDGEVKPMV